MDPIVFDFFLATFVPIGVYWVFSGIYALLGTVERYRLHSIEEEDNNNLVTRMEVVKGTLLQQAVQSTVSITMFLLFDDREAAMAKRDQALHVKAAQFVVATLVLDGWQFFMHRLMHQNEFLYRNLHSWHHRLTAPYACGTQYNHPLDGLLIETAAGMAAYSVSGMSPRTSVYFFSFSIVKALDDHCGLHIPWNPFHALFENNSAYHEIHHKLAGAKYNHGQTFLTVWDRMFGTYMPYRLERREAGGYDVVMDREKIKAGA